MAVSVDRKRAIAVWMARAWAVSGPLLIFCCIYFGLIWAAGARGYEANRTICAAIAGAVILVNSKEVFGNLLRALRYQLVKK